MNQYFSMMQRYYIVDDFYANPDMVRQYMLSMERNDTTDGNYAGVMTKDAFITSEHLTAISILVGERVEPSSGFTGKFRFTMGHEKHKQDIHFDPGDNNIWAGVIYMTPCNDIIDGTSFWRHKRTGLEDIPRTQEGISKHGWHNVNDLKIFLETDGVNYDLWDKVLTIPYKYNRLVLFRPWMFHSPGPAFGDTFETARTIQTLFFRPSI